MVLEEREGGGALHLSSKSLPTFLSELIFDSERNHDPLLLVSIRFGTKGKQVSL